MKKNVYLDHNATTPLCSEAKAAIAACLDNDFGNPSSVHSAGRRARTLIEQARAHVAALVGANPEEIVFTSGGTEANNLAIAFARGGKILTTTVEHPSVTDAAGSKAKRLPVSPEGLVDLDDLRRALTQDTFALVSIQWANHETGVLQPIAEVAALCRDHAVPLHVDAVQAAGKIPLALATSDIAMASLSAHKMCGPKGVGALYVRRGIELAPILHGGGQERRQRPGTENLLGIVGFGAAALAARTELPKRAAAMADLGRTLEHRLLKLPGVTLNGARDRRVPGTVNVCFVGVNAETVVQALDLEGVCVSTGAACSSGSLEPSPVLLAMGVPEPRARQAVRFSASTENTLQDIEQALDIIPKILARIRAHESVVTR